MLTTARCELQRPDGTRLAVPTGPRPAVDPRATGSGLPTVPGPEPSLSGRTSASHRRRHTVNIASATTPLTRRGL